jgi:hypothetical protein
MCRCTVFGYFWQANTEIRSSIPLQIPAIAGVDSNYHNSTDFGAVPTTNEPVIRSKINRERIFEDWAKKNEDMFLKFRPEVKTYGV